jgi:hypothetical protein
MLRIYAHVGQLVIQTNKAKTKPKQSQFKPKQTQFAERTKLMHSLYIQRINIKNTDRSHEKTNPKQTQFVAALPKRSRI